MTDELSQKIVFIIRPVGQSSKTDCEVCVEICPNPSLPWTTRSEAWCLRTPFTLKSMSMSDQLARRRGKPLNLSSQITNTQEDRRQLFMKEGEGRNCRTHSAGGEEQLAGGVTPGCMQCWVCACVSLQVSYRPPTPKFKVCRTSSLLKSYLFI